jgi:alanine dehydrogenase
MELANKGISAALNENKHLMNGLNIMGGKIVHPAIAEALNN